MKRLCLILLLSSQTLWAGQHSGIGSAPPAQNPDEGPSQPAPWPEDDDWEWGVDDGSGKPSDEDPEADKKTDPKKKSKKNSQKKKKGS